MDSKLILIGLTLISISLYGIGIASAESGTITLFDSTHTIATFSNSQLAGLNLDFTHFKTNINTYNGIGELDLAFSSSGYSFLKEMNSTSFTIVSGGSGTGLVSYSKANGSIDWVFSADTIITSAYFNLSYATNIFDSNNFFISDTFIDTVSSVDGSSGRNICLRINTTQANNCIAIIKGSGGSSATITYYQNPLQVSNTDYNIINGVPDASHYQVYINKSVTIPVNTSVHDYGTPRIWYNESSSNTVSYTTFHPYSSGIGILVKTATVSLDTVVNSTGTPASNQTTGGQGGSPSGQIYFDYSTAALTYSYGINVSLLAANWSSTFSPDLRIKVRDPLGNTVSGFPIDFSQQKYNTSRLWTFQRTGTYNASLYFCDYFDYGCKAQVELNRLGLGSFDGNVIDVATLTVMQTPYVYSITTNANSYTTGDVIRFTVSNPSPSTTFFNMFLQIGGQNLIIDRQVPANTTSYINWTVTGDMQFGTWESTLNTGLNGVGRVADKTFSIGNPTPGSRVSVRWDSNNGLGLTNNLYYTSNQNTSTVSVYKIFPGNNATGLFDTFQALSTDTQPKPYLMDVVGVWTAIIIDNGNSSNKSWSNVTVVANAATECNKNLPDYACWDKSSYVRGDAFVINYKASSLPTVVLGTLRVKLLIFDPDGILVLNNSIINTNVDPIYSIPTSGVFSKSFSNAAKVGKWHTILMRDGTKENNYVDGSQLADSYAVVVDTKQPVVNISTGGKSGINTCGFWDGWVSFIGLGVDDSTRFLFALGIIGLVVGIITGATKNIAIGAAIGFFPYAYFLFLSLSTPCGVYMPTWTGVMIALIIGIKLRWFS